MPQILPGTKDPEFRRFRKFMSGDESAGFRAQMMQLRLAMTTSLLIRGTRFAGSIPQESVLAVAQACQELLGAHKGQVPVGFIGGDRPPDRHTAAYRGRAADLLAIGTFLMTRAGVEVLKPATVMTLAFSIDALPAQIGDLLTGYPFSNEPPDLPTEFLGLDDVIGMTCLTGIGKALGTVGRAAMARPRQWTQGKIDAVNPPRGCAGDRVSIAGSRFGTTQPAGVRVFFSRGSSGCVEGHVVDWTDTAVTVIVPEGASHGCVGFMEDAGSAFGELASAADALAGEVQHCLGPVAFAGATSISRIGAALATACPVCNDPNARFGAGPPRINSFTADGGQVTDVEPGAAITLAWDIDGADTIDIAPAGASGLPPVGGSLAPAQGSVTTAASTLRDGDAGEYVLRARNRCGTTTARCAIACRGKVALVLSGGGSKGAFEAGAARCLFDVKKVKPDIIAGSSVGALNAAKLAEGGVLAITELEQLWLGLNTPTDFYLEPQWLQSLEPVLGKLMKSDASNLLFQAGGAVASFAANQMLGALAGAAGIPGAVFTIATSVFPVVTGIIDAAELISAVTQALNARNLFDNSPVVALIGTHIDPARIAGSGIALRVTIVGLNAGTSTVVDENGRMVSGSSGSIQPLREVLLASTSIPVAFAPVPFRMGTGNFEHFIDGGTRDNLPIRSAMDAGAQRVYAVLVSPPKIDVDSANFGVAKMFPIAVRSLLVVLDEMQQDDIAPYGGFGVPTSMAAPSFLVHDTLDVDPGLIAINMDYGYLRAYDEFVAASAERTRLYNNTDAIITARLEAWRLEHDVSGVRMTPPIPHTQTVKVPDPIALQMLRDVKVRVRDLTAWRVSRYGRSAVPAAVNPWWQEFERHPWASIVPTPWDSMSSRLGQLAAAPAPPPL
jgi:predicted acylesterase/phospholipase RssA